MGSSTQGRNRQPYNLRRPSSGSATEHSGLPLNVKLLPSPDAAARNSPSPPEGLCRWATQGTKAHLQSDWAASRVRIFSGTLTGEFGSSLPPRPPQCCCVMRLITDIMLSANAGSAYWLSRRSGLDRRQRWPMEHSPLYVLLYEGNSDPSLDIVRQLLKPTYPRTGALLAKQPKKDFRSSLV